MIDNEGRQSSLRGNGSLNALRHYIVYCPAYQHVSPTQKITVGAHHVRPRDNPEDRNHANTRSRAILSTHIAVSYYTLHNVPFQVCRIVTSSFQKEVPSYTHCMLTFGFTQQCIIWIQVTGLGTAGVAYLPRGHVYVVASLSVKGHRACRDVTALEQNRLRKTRLRVVSQSGRVGVAASQTVSHRSPLRSLPRD